MVLRKVWLVPIASSAFAAASFLAGYAIALAKNHVDAFLPYISDTGTFSPESCIFGQLLNLSALFLAFTAYLRHRQIVEYYGRRLQMDEGRWRTVSTVLLIIGYVSGFGMSLVANFQETNVISVHLVGAMTAFFAGLVYCWGQVMFSYVMKPRMSSLRLTHIRLLFSIGATVFLFLHVITMFAEPFVKSIDDNANITTTTEASNSVERYKPGAPEYANHLVVTSAEWLLAFCFELFIVSFAFELRNAYVHAPKLVIQPPRRQQKMDDSLDSVKISYIAPNDSMNSLRTASDTTLTSR